MSVPTLSARHPGFCFFCGYLLPLGDPNLVSKTNVTCSICTKATKVKNLKSIVTADGTYPMKSIPQDEKRYLENERNDFIRLAGGEMDEETILENAKLAGAATVDHECSKCGFGVASYEAIQMRSADEGQSIFYTCLKCKHKEKDANS